VAIGYWQKNLFRTQAPKSLSCTVGIFKVIVNLE